MMRKERLRVPQQKTGYEEIGGGTHVQRTSRHHIAVSACRPSRTKRVYHRGSSAADHGERRSDMLQYRQHQALIGSAAWGTGTPGEYTSRPGGVTWLAEIHGEKSSKECAGDVRFVLPSHLGCQDFDPDSREMHLFHRRLENHLPAAELHLLQHSPTYNSPWPCSDSTTPI